MLRGVNVGGHNKIKMDVLRDLCRSLKFQDPQTYLQSGNVLFRAGSQNHAQVSKLLETAIERKLGFRPDIVVRTVPELRDVIAHNPFGKRQGLDPRKLTVTFLAAAPVNLARKELLAMDIAPEELHARDRELYIYFPHGQGRPKLSWSRVEKILNVPFTTRSWNTVTELLQLGESLEASA